MKQKVKIYTNTDIHFEGKLQDIPLKEEYVIQKSIELFDDDDPCIIHKSYVVKEYADKILDLLKESTSVLTSSSPELFECLNIELSSESKIDLLG